MVGIQSSSRSALGFSIRMGVLARGCGETKGINGLSILRKLSADGKKGTSINIYSNIQSGSYTWESVGREVGGDILPNIEPVKVERR